VTKKRRKNRRNECLKKPILYASARRLDLDVAPHELAARRAQWKPPDPRFRSGVLAKYVKLVSSSSTGAVTDDFAAD
jgi:dihydroxyacid dehydratase/phosphogluconate dehydratase